MEAPAQDATNIWQLPRGLHKLPAQQIERSQRHRSYFALVQTVADKGYGATTVADICRRARISKSTFYAQFKDKEACYLSAYRIAHDELVAAIVGGQDHQAGWQQRIQESVRAYLRYNQDNPAVARSFLVEIHAVGEKAWALRDWGHEAFARMQRGLYRVRRGAQPTIPELPDELFMAMVAALEEMVCSFVRRNLVDRITQLEPRALFLLEAVYGGNPQATAWLKESPA